MANELEKITALANTWEREIYSSVNVGSESKISTSVSRKVNNKAYETITYSLHGEEIIEGHFSRAETALYMAIRQAGLEAQINQLLLRKGQLTQSEYDMNRNATALALEDLKVWYELNEGKKFEGANSLMRGKESQERM